MSTIPASTPESPDIQHTRWRIDPNTNNARRDDHLRSADFFDSSSHPEVRFVSELAIDVTTFADYRELGMTWNRLGMLRGPSKLIVRGRLVRDNR